MKAVYGTKQRSPTRTLILAGHAGSLLERRSLRSLAPTNEPPIRRRLKVALSPATRLPRPIAPSQVGRSIPRVAHSAELATLCDGCVIVAADNHFDSTIQLAPARIGVAGDGERHAVARRADARRVDAASQERSLHRIRATLR
jgi:hypothetical protein